VKPVPPVVIDHVDCGAAIQSFTRGADFFDVVGNDGALGETWPGRLGWRSAASYPTCRRQASRVSETVTPRTSADELSGLVDSGMAPVRTRAARS